MKKHTLYYIALSALAMLTGCSNEENFGLKPTDGNRSLTATIEQNDLSRTAVSEEGQVTWTETDAIGVFGTASQNIRFTYQSGTDNGNSATFRGDFPEEETMEQAYYPYQEDATLSGNALTLNLPSEYTYTGNSNAPMLGVKNNDGTFTFKHLTGLLRITINNVPEEADRFVITSPGETDAPDLTGQATITDINAEDATLSITANGSKSITYNLGTLTEETGFRTFFIPLPVGEYPQLSVALYAKDSTDPYFTKTISDITVRRAVMIDMPILDAQTGAQYVLSENTTEITESMAEHISVSPDDNTTLIYGSGIAEEDVPQIGDIIFAKPSESLPYGFLGKVTRVSGDANKGYTIQTETASLYEAFDKLYINDTAELVAITPSTRTEDTNIVTGDFGIEKELKVNYTNEESPYQIEGTLSAGASLQLTVEIDKEKQLKYMAFTFVPFVKAGAEFSVSDGWNEDGEFGDLPLKDYNCGLIMLGGVVPLVPAVQLHLYVQPQGSFSFTTGIECEAKGAAGAEFKNNVWESGFNPIESDEESPLDFLTSEIKVEGELFYGFGVELKGKFFNLDNMKMFIQPKAGLKLSGDFTVSSDNTLTWEEKLKDLSITSSNILSGSAGVDATLLGEDAESKFDFSEVEWGEKEYHILPILSKLSSYLIEEDSRAETTSPNTPEYRQVSISTKVSGELLTKDAELHIEVENAEGKVVKKSSPRKYNVKETGGILPLQITFTRLEPNADYKAYVVVNSPMFSDISEENRVELKSQAVEFDTNDKVSERELLIEFYKATGGDNWINNENWCSDKPIWEWYGVGVGLNGTGVGLINLDNNNLTGTADLRKFKDLVSFNCTNNSLTSINASGLENLEMIFLQNNPALASVDISRSTKISNLNFYNNNALKTLNISGATSLTNVQCVNTQLTSLDASNLPNLKQLTCHQNQLTSLNVTGSTKLEYISCSYNSLMSLNLADLEELTSLSCSYNQLINGLDLSDSKKLKSLGCNHNQLTDLKLPNSNGLEYLDCCYNQLTDLNVTNKPNLKTLICHTNKLTNLNISGSTNIEELSCGNNQLPSLNVSNLHNIKILQCWNNQITYLDVANLTTLESLWCSTNQLTDLDVSKLSNLGGLACGTNQLKELNIANLTNLISLECNKNQLNKLDVAELTNLTSLECAENQLTKLEVGKLTLLTKLDCSNNKLSVLNVDNFTNINYLNCSNNSIAELNVSHLTELESLFCVNNLFTTLDVSALTKMKQFRCGGEPLAKLYWQEGRIPMSNSVVGWGEYDAMKYRYPTHPHNYQYPEFIYK